MKELKIKVNQGQVVVNRIFCIHKGVSKRGDKWRARVQKDGVQHILGDFNTEEEAYKAYLAARKGID